MKLGQFLIVFYTEVYDTVLEGFLTSIIKPIKMPIDVSIVDPCYSQTRHSKSARVHFKKMITKTTGSVTRLTIR